MYGTMNEKKINSWTIPEAKRRCSRDGAGGRAAVLFDAEPVFVLSSICNEGGIEACKVFASTALRFWGRP